MQVDLGLINGDVMRSPEPRTVDLSGRIESPLLGKIQAGSLTCAQLETEIQGAFRDMGETKQALVFVRIVGFQRPNFVAIDRNPRFTTCSSVNNQLANPPALHPIQHRQPPIIAHQRACAMGEHRFDDLMLRGFGRFVSGAATAGVLDGQMEGRCA